MLVIHFSHAMTFTQRTRDLLKRKKCECDLCACLNCTGNQKSTSAEERPLRILRSILYAHTYKLSYSQEHCSTLHLSFMHPCHFFIRVFIYWTVPGRNRGRQDCSARLYWPGGRNGSTQPAAVRLPVQWRCLYRFRGEALIMTRGFKGEELGNAESDGWKIKILAMLDFAAEIPS